MVIDYKIYIFIIMLMTPLTYSYATDKNMNVQPLWNFANQLKNTVGTDMSALSSVFQTPVERIDAEFAERLTAKPFTLDGGIEIDNIVIRLARKHPGKVFIISFDISNICITREVVSKSYPELKLMDVPRGHSTNETFSWITPVDKNGNGTGFGFSQSKPSCLKNMTLRNFTS